MIGGENIVNHIANGLFGDDNVKADDWTDEELPQTEFCWPLMPLLLVVVNDDDNVGNCGYNDGVACCWNIDGGDDDNDDDDIRIGDEPPINIPPCCVCARNSLIVGCDGLLAWNGLITGCGGKTDANGLLFGDVARLNRINKNQLNQNTKVNSLPTYNSALYYC